MGDDPRDFWQPAFSHFYGIHPGDMAGLRLSEVERLTSFAKELTGAK